MMQNPINRLVAWWLKQNTWHYLWAPVLISIVLTELVVFSMSLLLLGHIDSGYLLTGLVAAGLVSLAVCAALLYLADKIREEEKRFRLMMETIHEVFWMADVPIEKMLYISPGYERIWGRTTASLYENPRSFIEAIHLKDRERVLSDLEAEKTGEPIDHEYRIVRPDGSVRWIWDRGFPIRDGAGSVTRYAGVAQDITYRKQAEEMLSIDASVFSHSLEAIVITDADNAIIDVNPAFTHITGYSREEVIGRDPKLLSSGRQDRAFYDAMWRVLKRDRAWRGEIWNRRKSGEVYAEMLAISVVCDGDGSVRNHVGMFSDISHIKEHEAELSRVANYDALTGIPNRRLLSDRLAQAIAYTRRSGKMLAICYIDLDGFKQVNDQHGHEIGDQLLVISTHRLQEVLRAGDTLARLGGDEFVVLFNGLTLEQECFQGLDRILAAISMPVAVGGHEVTVSASIGVTFYPADEEDGDILLRHADQAMYNAKMTGKNRFHVYDTLHGQQVRSLYESRQRIVQGLEKGEFELYYQPKVELASRSVSGAEALIRWNHPERGLLSPGEFLPLIDGSDLEIRLGEWVIDKALFQLGMWEQEEQLLEVSVNISARHLLSGDFVARLKSQLAKYPQLPRGTLQIEILETAALENIGKSTETMEACIKLGINFALDDFGTGYSSLAYLRRLSAETLKIDQSFVRGMLTDEGDRAIVQGIIALATTFVRKTVAEGLEAPEHIKMLLAMGCMYGQGYGIAHPMPAGDFQKWRNERRTINGCYA